MLYIIFRDFSETEGFGGIDMARKTLQELTMKDNFMFAAVMMNPDNCKVVGEYGRLRGCSRKSVAEFYPADKVRSGNGESVYAV